MNRKRWLIQFKIITALACVVIAVAFFFAGIIDVEASAATDDLIYSLHDFGDWVEETASTCQHEGVEVSKCRYCNVTRRRVTAKFDHCYVGETITEPGYLVEGLRRYTCIWCGATKEEAIPALGVTYTTTFVSPEEDPAGGVYGYVVYECDQDDALSYTEYLDETSYTKTEVPATCLEQGYTIYTCNVGDYSFEADYTAKTTHKWVEISRFAASCDDEGIIFYKCSICYSNYTVVQDSLGHNYVDKDSLSVEATCTEDGRDYGVCTRCGYVKDKVIPALGHDYVLDEAKSTATCTTSGVNYYVCSRCGKIKKVTALAPHTLTHYNATDTTIEYWYCSVCGKYFSDEDGTTEITFKDISAKGNTSTSGSTSSSTSGGTSSSTSGNK